MKPGLSSQILAVNFPQQVSDGFYSVMRKLLSSSISMLSSVLPLFGKKLGEVVVVVMLSQTRTSMDTPVASIISPGGRSCPGGSSNSMVSPWALLTWP